jgi:hypothetical protein
VVEGVRLPSGRVVRLEAVRVGQRWLTTAEAVQRFIEDQTPRLDGTESAATPAGEEVARA